MSEFLLEVVNRFEIKISETVRKGCKNKCIYILVKRIIRTKGSANLLAEYNVSCNGHICICNICKSGKV
jgi:hypothetical protein